MARRFALTVIALCGTSAVIYSVYLHQSLSRKVKHRSGIGLLTVDENKTVIESLPAELADPSQFHIVNDVASKSVPTSQLRSTDPDLLLTKYLQRSMSCFSRFPQALLLRLVFKTAEAKETFKASYIQKLNFAPGDTVCGGYRVVVRTGNRVEFEMLTPEGFPPINGRLLTSIQQKGEQTVFVTETLQWRRREDKGILPLERKLMRWLHELAGWWLLETGTNWLCSSQLGP